MAAQNQGFDTSGDGSTGCFNLGNSCYISSVFQCLVHTDPLRYYFITQPIEAIANWGKGMDGRDGWVAFWFMLYVRQEWSNKFTSIRYPLLRQQMGRYNPEFAAEVQCDAQEFFSTLVDALNDDLRKPPVEIEQGVTNPQNIHLEATRSWAVYSNQNNSIITELFTHQSVRRIICGGCHATRLRFQEGNVISVTVEEDNDHQTLDDMLRRHLFNDDPLELDICDICGRRGSSPSQNRLWSLPTILVIHLTRFRHENIGGQWEPRKVHSNVDYPLRLNLGNYLHSEKQKQGLIAIYDLFGVVVHKGPTSHNGHYWAMAKTSHGTKGLGWRRFDDHRVFDIPDQKAKTPFAYLLFYVKRVA